MNTRSARSFCLAALVAAVAAGVTAVPASAQTVLRPTEGTSLPSLARDIALGDLDADGDLDQVLTFRSTTPELGVLLGDGAGGFGALVRYPLPASGRVSVGDLDGDADDDVVVTVDGQNRVSVLLSDGGLLRPARTVGTRVDAAAVVVRDVTSDGRPDIVVGGRVSRSVAVLVNTGAGGFAPAAVSTAGRVEGEFAVADVDSDGRPDVLVADRPSTSILLLRGMGDGRFAAPVAVLANATSDEVTIADLDGNGTGDIVGWRLMSNGFSSPVVTVALGRGDGTFAARGTIPVTNNSIDLDALTVADVDSDGRSDVVVSTFDQITVLYGAGGRPLVSRPVPVTAYFKATAIAAGDLDGDGRLDLAAAGERTLPLLNLGLSVLPVRFDPPMQSPAGLVPDDLAIGNLDADGALDAAVVDRQGALSLLLGDGTGRLTPSARFAGVSVLAPGSVAVADLDLDGRLDVTVSSGTLVRTFLGDGAGGATPGPDLQLASEIATIVLADLDADGVVDLITDTDVVAVALGDGTGGFEPTGAVTSLSGLLTVADVDADGNLDLVGNIPSAVGIAYGDGTAGFGVPQPVPGAGPSVEVGDVTGDGLPDLVSELSTVPGLGSRTFGAPIPGDDYSFSGPFQLVDIDADGRLDRVGGAARSSLTDLVKIQLGIGNGRFFDGVPFLGGPFPVDLDIGDMDGDGRLDILTGSGSASNVSVLPNRTVPTSQDLLVTDPAFRQERVVAGGTVGVREYTSNVGDAAAAASRTAYLLTPSRSLADAVPLGVSRAVPTLGPGVTNFGTATVTIPVATAPGFYQLAACADDTDAVTELDELNNCTVSGATIRVTAP